MKIIRAGLLVASLCLAGCQTNGAPIQRPVALGGHQYILSQSDRAAIVSAMNSELRDPESVRYGGFNAVQHPNGVVEVCGLINAKNGYGGYNGMTPYNGILATNLNGKRVFAITALADTPTTAMAITVVCQRDGVK